MKKKENIIKGLTVFAVLIAALMISFILSGCDQQGKEVIQLVLKDIAQERSDSIDGFLGTVEIYKLEQEGRKLTPIDETGTQQIIIQNQGTADLIINDVSVYRESYETDAGEMPAEFFQNIFKIVEGTKPDFPLVVPPGGSFTGLYVSFNPDGTCVGETTGVLALESNAGEKFFRLWGDGAWKLGLKVTGANGRITAPIKVEFVEGEKTYYATQNEVTLECETADPLELIDLDNWSVESGDAWIDDPDTPEDESELLTTVVTLNGHTVVHANFLDYYVYVSDDFGNSGNSGLIKAEPKPTIAEAVTVYNDNDYKKGICVADGTYSISADQMPERDILFRGGYEDDFNSRDIATHQTNLNTGSSSLVFEDRMTEDTLLEGFTIAGSTGTAVTPVYINKSDVVLSSNTITAPVSGYAIGIENHADPTIENNVIYGANDGLRSVGIYVNDYSDPTIRNNTIIAGNPTSHGGESIAVYVDWFSNPVIDGNILTAGQATGGRGKSAGIYSINSSSPTIKNNIISAGYGKSVSYALYFSYGGWPVIDSNVMFTPESGSQSKYGMYIGSAARIDSMTRNNLYGFPDGFALIYTEDRALKTIEEINDRWVPENSGYEEPDNYSEEP